MMMNEWNWNRTSTDDRNEISVKHDFEKQEIDFVREVNFEKE
jgi:hypothetical protein